MEVGGFVFIGLHFLAMLYSDSFILLACETYNPNVSSECAHALLLILFSSPGVQYSKTVVYFQLKSLETHPNQTKTRNYPTQKYRLKKRRKERSIKRGNMLAKISCVCESGQNA